MERQFSDGDRLANALEPQGLDFASQSNSGTFKLGYELGKSKQALARRFERLQAYSSHSQALSPGFRRR